MGIAINSKAGLLLYHERRKNVEAIIVAGAWTILVLFIWVRGLFQIGSRPGISQENALQSGLRILVMLGWMFLVALIWIMGVGFVAKLLQ